MVMESISLYARQASLLWLAGFKEACCIHRVFRFCIHSRPLSIRTGQCFLLNGIIFLGSLLFLNSVVVPVLLWILPGNCELPDPHHLCERKAAMAFYSFLRTLLVRLFYIFWFYPLYVFSIVLSNMWYNDIAKHAFEVLKKKGPFMEKELSTNDVSGSKNSSKMIRPGGFDGVILGIGEQIYSVLLLTFFFLEVLATGFIPYVGKTVNFLLLSWMYAYYCFEYKWNLSEVSLNERLNIFESNWAFFAGFGSPCVLAIFFFPPLVSYGVMAILFPLFVLTAAGCKEGQVIDSVRRSWEGRGPGKLRIFYAADLLSMLVLKFFPETLKEL